jgi:ubiquinone/menaquinone biosynthesis C-methylase UbiE
MAKPLMIDDDALDDLERELMGRARGRVLEIGAGRGENFGAFRPDIAWHGLEPDAERRAELARRAREWGHEASPMDAVAEQLPLGEASVDTVVATYVLCTVTDVETAVAEARRVLTPGGRVLLVEHVLAPHSPTMRGLQHVATPFTKRWCGGCHQDRDPLPALRAAGFTDVEVRHRRVHDRPLPPESILLYEGVAPR